MTKKNQGTVASGMIRGKGIKAVLSERELATVLAALRFWQAVGPKVEGVRVWDKDLSTEEQDYLDEIRTDAGRFEDLDIDEIDKLCERLNFGGKR